MPKNEISIGRIQQLVGEKELNMALLRDEIEILRNRVEELEQKLKQLDKELESCRNIDTSQSS